MHCLRSQIEFRLLLVQVLGEMKVLHAFWWAYIDEITKYCSHKQCEQWQETYFVIGAVIDESEFEILWVNHLHSFSTRNGSRTESSWDQNSLSTIRAGLMNAQCACVCMCVHRKGRQRYEPKITVSFERRNHASNNTKKFHSLVLIICFIVACNGTNFDDYHAKRDVDQFSKLFHQCHKHKSCMYKTCSYETCYLMLKLQLQQLIYVIIVYN